MKVPPSLTEEAVIEAITRAIDVLASHHTFGIYSEEDIRQEGWVYALEVLEKEKYDEVRPLASFLYTHIRNRYLNLLRDKFRRNDPPCLKCHVKDYCTETGSACRKYEEWLKRNNAKANLQRPQALDHISTEERERNARVDSHVPEDAALAELLIKIDLELSMDLRPDYLKMKAGVSVPKARRLLVEAAVTEIISCPETDL